ncbi:putative bifunctional diguanylate cyclase/phosphodiesterase [Congregibacter sp.]|uniref:putative bifunctional diguanylate cyclase/phosphodiesterase n=1 Tax=Congregibacter sp. TaxID=2744308 RepID=UPI00385CBB64
MPEGLFSDQTILLTNSLLVSLLLGGLWLSDRGQRHNLYWAGGLFALFITVATLPAVTPGSVTPVIWLCVLSVAAAIPLLLQGTAIYAHQSFSGRYLFLAAVATVLSFALLRAMNLRGVIVPVMGLVAVFWYIALTLRVHGVAEKIAAFLFFVRGVTLLLAAFGSGLTLDSQFLRVDLIVISQFAAMASSLSLLFVAFLANQRELDRGRLLLRQSNRIAQRLGQLSSTQSVVKESIDLLLEAEPGSTVWMYRLDEDKRQLVTLETGGRLGHLAASNPELALEGSLSGAAVRSGSVQVVEQMATDSRVNDLAQSLARKHAADQIGTMIIIPLLSGERVYGTCNYVLGGQRKLNEADYEGYAALGRTIGLALSSVGHLEQMTFRANHDSLTSLPNRGALHETFRQHVLENPDSGACLFLLDLDKFKEVNDTLGHHVGDQLLKEIGPRLSEIDAPGELLASRLGGDEFVLLLKVRLQEAEATALGMEILEAVRAPYVADDLSLSIDGSIGVAITSEGREDSHEMLRCADVAMYQAKSSATPVVVYDQSFDPHSRERLALMSQLKACIGGDQLLLHYQPKVHLASGRVTGVEALLRWQHPEHGLVPPARFIPMAEVSPMINPISLWVIAQAIEKIKSFGGQNISVAVNISMRNLADDTWYQQAIDLIQQSGVNPRLLELELTESVFMQAPEEVSRKLNALTESGVLISIDDFGTGYSSLNYLRKLPIRQLKIDRSFVMNLDSDPSDRQIIESILSLASAMDLEVVAEGVESEHTLQHLRELNCDYAQGFYICKPLPPDEIDGWLREFNTAERHPSQDSPAKS